MLSGFFEGNDGCWYPADRIRWIGRRPSEQGIKPTALGHTTPVNVHMQDEGAVQIHERRVDELLRQPVHVWPALPGCFVIHIWDEEEEIGAGKTAIIAWCIARDGRVYPITVSGVNDAPILIAGLALVIAAYWLAGSPATWRGRNRP